MSDGDRAAHGALEERIVALLADSGPQTGAEIRASLGEEQQLEQWRLCSVSPLLAKRRVGRRYLRLDEKVEGYARLSPSILREFLTYTVVGLSSDLAALEERAALLAARIEEISAAKLRLATRVVEDVVQKLPAEEAGGDQFAVLVAGDIVYRMAHDAPRPERSTGQMVRGSDLDLVVILEDSAPESLERHLDEGIYQQKYRHLINPSVREEIDYAVKRLARVREQVAFGTFREMVSCKIMDEAELLLGSTGIFAEAKALLAERDIPARLAAMEQDAVAQREETETHLLRDARAPLTGIDRNLFCGTEETPEFD